MGCSLDYNLLCSPIDVVASAAIAMGGLLLIVHALVRWPHRGGGSKLIRRTQTPTRRPTRRRRGWRARRS